MPKAPAIYRPAGYGRREKGWASRQTNYRAWYRLALWKGKNGLRKQQLAREPLCEECRSYGLTVLATDVDHRKAHKGDWQKFIDPKNHRSLCKRCHSRKTRREDMD